ncbi:MAG: hypothetical protein KC731_04020 [Myxococcales bacterium]|nr:hypothetical protein [Myxococcales bacterium]
MSKFTKLINDPVKFVRDSKAFRRYVVGVGAPPKPKPKKAPAKAHPLPTLNLAQETELSDRDLERIGAEREYFRWRASPEAFERVMGRLGEQIRAFMVECGFEDRDYLPDVRDFFASYKQNPAVGMRRTTAVGSLLWIFVIARAAKPKVAVESGVYKGASLYTLRSAAPDAQLYGFDIDLTNIVFEGAGIQFHEGDWSEAFPKAEGPDDLVYFDDHINNCLRVRQAYDLGFRHLIFDDSPDIGSLHQWRYPGTPTIQMVVNETLEPGEWVEWLWKNKRLRYVYDLAHTHGAADLVEYVGELPSLTHLTGCRTGIQTYVRLKRKEDG